MMFGVYRGLVADTADSEALLRIRFHLPQLFGEGWISEWAWPCFPPGWKTNLEQAHPAQTVTDPQGGTITIPAQAHTLVASVPPLGQGVWVMFEGGDVDHPVWMGSWSY